MGILDSILGSSGGASTKDLLSPDERMSKDLAAKYLRPYFSRQEPYPGDLFTDYPAHLETAYGDYTRAYDDPNISSAITQMIQGRPAWQYNPKGTVTDWKNLYATPIMESYRDLIMPSIWERGNLPGVAASTTLARQVQREAGSFYGSQVAPTLFTALEADRGRAFQSGEAAAGRRMDALSLPARRFSEAAGAAQTIQQARDLPRRSEYADWLRTQQPNPEVAMALGIQPSRAIVGEQGQSGILGDMLSMGGQLGLMKMFGVDIFG